MPKGSGLDSPYVDIGMNSLTAGFSVFAGIMMATGGAGWLPAIIAGGITAIASFFFGESAWDDAKDQMREVRQDAIDKIELDMTLANQEHGIAKMDIRDHISAANRDESSSISDTLFSSEDQRFGRQMTGLAEVRNKVPQLITDTFYDNDVYDGVANYNNAMAYGDKYMEGLNSLYGVLTPSSLGRSPNTAAQLCV